MPTNSKIKLITPFKVKKYTLKAYYPVYIETSKAGDGRLKTVTTVSDELDTTKKGKKKRKSNYPR